MAHNEREDVWQGRSTGFESQIERAKLLENSGSLRQAACLYATAYYSHYSGQIRRNPLRAIREFGLAHHYASLAAYEIEAAEPGTVSHGQYDVVGTILLREWLWIRSNPNRAMSLLAAGLQLNNVPPHSRALMTIGMAEGYYQTGSYPHAWMMLQESLDYEPLVAQEEDYVQARRQFGRVLRRAAVLAHRMDDRDLASGYFDKARLIAQDRRTGSADQLHRLNLEMRILRLPRLVQALLPH